MFPVGLSTICPILEAFTPHKEETPKTLTAPRRSARCRACCAGSMKSPLSTLHLLGTISTKSHSQTCPSTMSFSVQMEHFYTLGLTFFPKIFYGQEHSHPQHPLLDPDPCRSWEYKDNFTVWRALRIHKLLKGNLKSPMTQQALVPSQYSSPAKFPATSGVTKLLIV